MFADNRSNLASTLLTFFKLGAAIAVLFFLGNLFLDQWQANVGHEIIRDAVQDMQSEK